MTGQSEQERRETRRVIAVVLLGAVIALVVWIFATAGVAMGVIFALAAVLTIGPVLWSRNQGPREARDEYVTPKEPEKSLFDPGRAVRDPFARQVQKGWQHRGFKSQE